MFNDFSEDAQFEANAAYDYKIEAYGDRCPGCGTLRWGGDCSRCMKDGEDTEDFGSSPARPTLDQDPSDDLPLGECQRCGADFYDEGEMRMHEYGDCVGYPFDTLEEARGEW